MPSHRNVPPKQDEAASSPGPRTLKKYPNRRLYDTRTSSYITLADVKRMVLAGEDFEVRDAKTGEDLTRSILLQIILEEESGGVPMFTTPMLAQHHPLLRPRDAGRDGHRCSRSNLQAFAETCRSKFVQAGQAPRDAEPDGQLPRAVAHDVREDAGTDDRRPARCSRVSRRRSADGPRRLPVPSETIGAMHRHCFSAHHRFRLARLPEGADRLRAHPHAAQRRGLRTSKTFAGADLVIVNTCGFIDDAVKESLDTIGEALAANGKVIVTGCLGAQAGRRRRQPGAAGAPEGAGRHRPACDAGGDGRGAPARAQAARSLRRPGARGARRVPRRRRHQAHAAPLRLPEDQRGLQPPLHLLHHPAACAATWCRARSATC